MKNSVYPSFVPIGIAIVSIPLVVASIVASAILTSDAPLVWKGYSILAIAITILAASPFAIAMLPLSDREI